VLHGDARTILERQADRRYDVVVTDAFHDITIPFHLVTREYIATARSRMRDDGLFVTNVVDRFPNPRMVKSLVKTLQQQFRHVDVWLDEVPEQAQRMTFVISASDRQFDDDVLFARRGFDRRWFRMTEPLLASGDRLADLPLFTDDYVPVERLMAGLLFTGEGL
jgi:spermidine synthase